MSRATALRRILSSGGVVFGITFIKRTNGEIRRMQARLHVTSHLKGGGRAYEFEDYGLVPVFDMGKQEYRCFPLDGLQELRINGEVHQVV